MYIAYITYVLGVIVTGQITSESKSRSSRKRIARINTASFQVILGIRTWAIYGRNKRVGLGIALLMFINMIAQYAVIAVYNPSMKCAFLRLLENYHNQW